MTAPTMERSLVQRSPKSSRRAVSQIATTAGLLQPSLHRNGVEATAHRVGAPHHLDTMQPCQVSFEDRRNRKDAVARPAELPEKL